MLCCLWRQIITSRFFYAHTNILLANKCLDNCLHYFFFFLILVIILWDSKTKLGKHSSKTPAFHGHGARNHNKVQSRLVLSKIIKINHQSLHRLAQYQCYRYAPLTQFILRWLNASKTTQSGSISEPAWRFLLSAAPILLHHAVAVRQQLLISFSPNTFQPKLILWIALKYKI